jgi:hypothetical protein
MLGKMRTWYFYHVEGEYEYDTSALEKSSWGERSGEKEKKGMNGEKSGESGMLTLKRNQNISTGSLM